MINKSYYIRITKFYKMYLKDKKIKIKIKLLFKWTFKLFFRKFILKGNLFAKFLFVITSNRLDHQIQFNKIYNSCNEEKSQLKIKEIFTFQLLYFFKIITNLKINLDLIKNHGFLDGNIIFIRILFLDKLVPLYKKIESSYIISFSDVHPLEDLLLRVSKRRNIKLISLQHGLFIDYLDYESIHKLNYIDIPSDYLLAWGNSSRNLFRKYNPNLSVVICGKPYINIEKPLKLEKKIIGVVLDNPYFSDFNKKMIIVAQECASLLNYKITVKSHPADQIQNYFKIIDKNLYIEKDINSCMNIIFHTTTMLYEFLALDYNVFKMKSNIPTNDIDNSRVFSSSNELIKKIKDNNSNTIKSNFYIECFNDISLNKYSNFFKKVDDYERK